MASDSLPVGWVLDDFHSRIIDGCRALHVTDSRNLMARGHFTDGSMIYSYRKAVTGSTRIARREGTSAASSEMARNSNTTPAKEMPSMV